jgi:L-2-hydroxycarboxylate dehydrogenase (NAD+)
MSEYVVPESWHDRLARAALTARGFTASEADAAARLCRRATRHGIKTHSLLKALHLDDHFGTGHSTRPGCVPAAEIEKLDTPFKASQKWDAHRKLGPAVAYEAMDTAMHLADEFGVGIVSVDSAFHYLWGGGYVMDAAERGYIAYTACTAALAEVVPFGGKTPTMGTNPHSWAFPTTDAIGFPIVIDWATSAIAMGKVQSLAREGKSLPPDAALDANGQATTDPKHVAALKPFGAHKGYGLSLIDELLGAFIGGSLPTLRSRPEQAPADEKTTPNFFFQVVHPDALDCGRFAAGRDRAANVKAVIEDILGHGNEDCILPGQIEHQAAQRSDAAGGLLVTEGEITELKALAEQLGLPTDEITEAQLSER